MMVAMVRLTPIAEYAVVFAGWVLGFAVATQIAPGWSDWVRFGLGMFAAVVALRVAQAVVYRGGIRDAADDGP